MQLADILYHLAARAAHPLLPLWLGRRVRQGKEIPARVPERLGVASVPRPVCGRLVWFHAASMGESICVLPLIQKIIAQHPDCWVLLTTVTRTSAEYLAPRLPQRVLHQFIPVDTPVAVARFLQHWRPDVAVLVESELWPVLIHRTGKAGIPLLLLNARVSDRSFARWQRFPALIARLLRTFSAVVAKSEEDAARLRALGALNVQMLGNLKFASPPLPSDPKITAELVSMLGERPCWLAASTHEGEEAIVAEAHVRLEHQHKDLLSIIVPRHANRGEAIASQLQKMGLRVALRSKGQPVQKDTQIYLADTMGELGVFYRLCGVVFIGGSLVEHGGQNPFEAARLDCAVLYGPYMNNFREFCAELEAANACLLVQDAAQLQEQVSQLLSDQELQEQHATAATHLVRERQHVLEQTYQALKSYVE